MSDKVKQLAPEIWAEIQKAKKILVNCHYGPDPDSLGGALALMHVLEKIGKNVTVISGDSQIDQTMDVFPGREKILNKNVFEINLEDFDLFIIPDTANYEQLSRKGKVVFPKNLRTVVIDHHVSNPRFANINLIDAAYPATCQLLFDLFEEFHTVIDKNTAICLFVGIYADTGGFKYPPTNAETFAVASELTKIAPDFFRIISQIENSFRAKQLEFLGLALSSIKTYFGNKVAISEVSYDQLKEKKIDKEAARSSPVDLANKLRSVKEWKIGISLVEFSPGMVNISLRKQEYEPYDLSAIAIKVGGGGHPAAAGGTIKMPFAEAKKFLLEKIQEVYPDLRQGN